MPAGTEPTETARQPAMARSGVNGERNGAARGFRAIWIGPDADASPGGAPLLDRVLLARGFGDVASAGPFLEPSMRHLHDPSLMPGLDEACVRITEAVIRGQRIVIYGDYDVDGVTATAILYHMIRHIDPGARVETYIPHRIDEGYGVNADALRTIAADGADLIVTVDCGITAREPAELARTLGVDLIITDHHNPPSDPSDLPSAHAVVHPAIPGSRYPFADLCGAGVAYKIAWRLATLWAGASRVDQPTRDLLMDLLGLAALGTIADVVPLVDENRAIVKFGLPRIRRTRIEGLLALIDASGLGGASIAADDVGFRLAPRMNACGRLGHARETLELLTTAVGARATDLARQLGALNDRRREMEREIFDQACAMVENSGFDGQANRAIVLSSPQWHPGVVGIVGSRLTDRYARPTILLCEQDGLMKGSGRSVDGFNLHAALCRCESHLRTFGGHNHAAGLSLLPGAFDGFREAFTRIAGETLKAEDLAPKLRYDACAVIGELTPDAVGSLSRLEPFGRANPPVRLRLSGLRLASDPTPFGATGRHLGFGVTDPSSGRSLRLIGWNLAGKVPAMRRGSRLDAIVTPKLSSWQGRSAVEPVIEDLALALAEPEIL